VPFEDDVPARLRALDLGAVAAIEAGDAGGFADYVTATGATVTAGLDLAHAVSRGTGLPVRFWAMLAHLAPNPAAFSPLPWLPLTRQITTPLDPRPLGQRRRSSIV